MPWKLAALNLSRNRTRSLLTLSAISFGCIALIVSGGFLQDSVTEMKENYIRAFLGHIRIVQKGFFEKGLLDPYSYMISNASELIARISTLPGIQAVTPRLEFPGLLSTGEATIPFMAQAVDPDTEKRVSLNFKILQGQNLQETDDFGIILGKGLAETMEAKPGTQVTVLVNTARGGINALDLTVKGIFQTISKNFDDHAVRLTLSTGQKLLRTPGVHTLTVFIQNTDDTDQVIARLRHVFKVEHLDLDTKPWYALEDADFVNKLVPFYSVFYGVLRFVIIMMVIFGIFNTINTSVLERIGEIGTLGALGTSKRQIIRLFMAEGLLLGVFGAGIGLVGGYIMSIIISAIGIPMPIAPGTTMRWISHIEFVPLDYVWTAGLVIIAALASTYYPARKAAKLDIAEALRHNV